MANTSSTTDRNTGTPRRAAPRVTIRKRGAVTIRVDRRKLDKEIAEADARHATAEEHSMVFDLLDAVSQAKVDLEGTVQVMSLIIDADKEYTDGVPATLERWIKMDMDTLNRAFDAAWDGLVRRPQEGGAL